MDLRIALVGVVALSMYGSVWAQTADTSDQRMDRFEQRLNELDKKYQAELRSRDEEISRLRALVEKSQREKPPLAARQEGKAPTSQPDEIEKTKQDVLNDIESRQNKPFSLRTPANFNPDMAVVGDWRGNVSTRNDNPARNRVDLGSVELDLRAAVDPRADGVVVLPVARDVKDPLFFNGEQASGSVDTAIEIEEAYIFLHDFGIPNLTAKLGRFHLRFGRWNQLHLHNWPTVDNAFAVQSFLGPEALADSGVSLSYILPPKLVGDQYIELIAEIISGEGGEESPVLNNDAFVHSPALNTHILWNHDLTREWNLELGSSWLTGKHNNDDQQNANLFGADFTLIHTDPTGGFNNQLFQGEVFYGNVDSSPTQTQHSWGAYLLAQQQINRDWYLGTRLDWTQDALNDDRNIWAVSPYASWYLSEFLRLRLQYEHRAGDAPTEDILWFQATFVFGAHPPHPYWATR